MCVFVVKKTKLSILWAYPCLLLTCNGKQTGRYSRGLGGQRICGSLQ